MESLLAEQHGVRQAGRLARRPGGVTPPGPDQAGRQGAAGVADHRQRPGLTVNGAQADGDPDVWATLSRIPANQVQLPVSDVPARAVIVAIQAQPAVLMAGPVASLQLAGQHRVHQSAQHPEQLRRLPVSDQQQEGRFQPGDLGVRGRGDRVSCSLRAASSGSSSAIPPRPSQTSCVIRPRSPPAAPAHPADRRSPRPDGPRADAAWSTPPRSGRPRQATGRSPAPARRPAASGPAVEPAPPRCGPSRPAAGRPSSTCSARRHGCASRCCPHRRPGPTRARAAVELGQQHPRLGQRLRAGQFHRLLHHHTGHRLHQLGHRHRQHRGLRRPHLGRAEVGREVRRNRPPGILFGFVRTCVR